MPLFTSTSAKSAERFQPSPNMLLLAILLIFVGISYAAPPTREQKVRDDRARVEADGFWIYNDLNEAYRQARESGKPIVVVLRCIPCEECVKLDDDLVDQDPIVRPLLEKFVCVRLVATNGLDLELFQYDTDQSFAIFFLNADRTIYGRFGTRSHRTDWLGDVSLKGLAKALQGALELHADYPANRDQLVGKRGPAPMFASPEKFPRLRDKYTAALNYEGNVVQSCIHCHQIGDAIRDDYRSQHQPIPESVLFPYPHPKSVGLILDPNETATVLRVVPGSWGAEAGLQANDKIRSANEQPMLSIADLQWVLQQTPAEGGDVPFQVLRGETTMARTMHLPRGWRRADDISWRVSSWGLRRMTTGGLVLKELDEPGRTAAQLEPGQMGLRVEFVGQYNEHRAAKDAGFAVGDILTSFDGRTDLMRESDLFLHAVTECQPGTTVAVGVLRDNKRLQLNLPMQQ